MFLNSALPKFQTTIILGLVLFMKDEDGVDVVQERRKWEEMRVVVCHLR